MQVPLKMYETLYTIDTAGIIKTADGKVVTPAIHPRTKYPCVLLWRDTNCDRFSVHLLVANQFMPNPQGCLYVRHKGAWDNTAVDNLKWSNSSESPAHQIGMFLPLADVKLMTEFYRTLLFNSYMTGIPSTLLAEKAGLCVQQLHKVFKRIAAKCDKEQIYADLYDTRKAQRAKKVAVTSKKTVEQYNLLGHLVHTYDSVQAAADAMGTTTGTISNAAHGRNKTCKGYVWKYV